MPTNTFVSNMLYNIIGGIVPLIVAFLAIPFLVYQLGVERFGVLALLWIVLAYFTIFDVGIGRAVTRFVAHYIAQQRDAELPSLVWTSVTLISALGIVGALVFFVATPLLVEQMLQVPGDLIEETYRSFYVMAFGVPFLVNMLAFRGVLEAQNRFDLVNLVLVPSRSINYIAPAVAATLSHRLDIVAGALLVNQIVTSLVFLALCLKLLPNMKQRWLFNAAYVKPLFNFGGWLSISSVVSPVMEYTDRFMIGSIVSLAAVTYYATPYEAVSKLMFVPVAMTGVLFPIFSSLVAQRSKSSFIWLYRSVKLTILVVAPMVVTVTVMAEDILTIWVGAAFAQQSTTVFRLLVIGFLLINSVGRVFTNWIHANGEPEVTAKLHLLELPLYLALLWVLLHKYGILGVAIAWVVRVAVDTASLAWFSFGRLGEQQPAFRNVLLLILVACLWCVCSIIAMIGETDVLTKIVFLLLILSGYVLVAWTKLLSQEERYLVVGHGKHIFQKFGWSSSAS